MREEYPRDGGDGPIPISLLKPIRIGKGKDHLTTSSKTKREFAKTTIMGRRQPNYRNHDFVLVFFPTKIFFDYDSKLLGTYNRVQICNASLQ
jgi:hypothetical protein